MSTPESVRSFVLSEIEESLIASNVGLRSQSHFSDTGTKNMDSADRDYAVPVHSLRKAIFSGLDSGFIPSLCPNRSCFKDPSSAVNAFEVSIIEDSVLEDQLDVFFSNLVVRYGFEVHTEPDETETDACWRDKILTLKFGESPFDTFLAYVQDMRPPLHRALCHHPLVTAKHKSKRKLGLRNRFVRKDRKEHSGDSDLSYTTRGFKRKFDVYDIDSDSSHHAREEISEEKRKAQLLAGMVAKCVADGSLQSYLVTVSVLMYELLSSEDKGTRLSSDSELPVGNVLAALFENGGLSPEDMPRQRSHSEDIADNTSDSPKLSLSQCNPFRSSLRSSRLSSAVSVCAQHASVTSRGDGGSVSTTDERHSELGSLYAPSNVGSLQAEMGTETASMTDMNEREGVDEENEDRDENDAEDEEEEDDDELLAQALAMSMGNEIAAAAAASSTEAVHTITSSNLPALSESSLSRLPDKRTRIPSPTSQTESVQERVFDAVMLRALAGVHPLSTFGPFCDAEFWRAVRGEAPSADPLAYVSLENTITALLVNIAASVDVAYETAATGAEAEEAPPGDQLSSRVSLARSVLLSLGVAASETKEGGSGGDGGGNVSGIPLARATPLVLHPVTFLILEMLFDMFLTALSGMSPAPRGKSMNGDDSSVTAWKAKRSFLVYGLTVLLKLLGTKFRIIAALGTAPSSVGLVQRKAGGSSVHTVVDRLLRIVLECIGADILPVDLASLIMSKGSAPAVSGADEGTHALRLLAIDTLTAGFSVFFSESHERQSLILTLLRTTGVRTGFDENIALSNSYPAMYSCRGPNKGDTAAGGEYRLHTDSDYYRCVLLQKICAVLADSDWLSISSDDYAGVSAADREKSSRAPSRPSITDRSDRAQILDHLRSLLPNSMGSNEAVLESMFEAVVEAQELGVPSPFPIPREPAMRGFASNFYRGRHGRSASEVVSSVNNDFIATLESMLIHRLGCSDAISEFSLSDRILISPMSSLLWGEMCLLFKLQQRRNFEFSQLNMTDDDPMQEYMEFDSKKSSNHLMILGDRNSVIHTAGKSWATAVASKGYEPNTGEHTWAVKLDRCDKGHVFIGMATQSAGLENYVGGDKNGWGYIGTRDLWHNSQKVKSKFGEGFSSKSVVYVRYDSNQSTISFSSANSDHFEIAFSNIPKVTVYPAVSLYQQDDRMTLVEPDPVRFSEEEGIADGLPLAHSSGHAVFARISPAVSYALAVFDKVECVLDRAQNCADTSRRWSLLNHPFLTALLPSLVAAVASTKSSPRIATFVAIHLLPHLTMLVKRLSHLHDVLDAENSPRIRGGDFGFIGDISGEWYIDSSAAGNNIQAQQYRLALVAHPIADAEDGPGNERKLRATKLTGFGRDSTSVEILGTLYGTRIRFLETWNMSGKCLIDCRMSLDGNSFFGKFKDIKSGSSGSLRGTRVSQSCTTRQPYNLLLKTAILSSMACGKLAAQLILGLEPVPSLDVFDSSDSFGDMPILGHHGSDTTDMSDSMQGDSKEETSEDNEPAVLETSVSSLSVEEATLRWMCSGIFAGGLKEDAEFIGAVGYQLRSYLSLSATTVSTEVDTYNLLSPDAAKLKSWWLEQTFTRLHQYCAYAGNCGDTTEFRYVSASVESPSPRVEDAFLGHLQNGTGIGKRIDDHMIRHTGMSVVCKVGGDTMQAARRRVLASLLYHSGCVGLCHAEDKALSMEDRDESDKPHPILQDIWRAGQKIIEHAIRRKQTAGVSYGFLSQELSRKADFFMQVRPNTQCMTITLALASHDTLPISARRDGHSEGVGSLTVDHVKAYVTRSLAEMVEFFQSSKVDITLLRASFFKAALRAISRTAGLRSMVVLLGKASGACAHPSDISARLPSLTSLHSQPFAVECIHPSLYGMTGEAPDCGATSRAESAEDNDLSILGGPTDQVTFPSGHFMMSLQLVGDEHLRDLRTAFEGTYELITQMLQRCTWAGDRDGQCVALSAWDISIIPADHTFLNRIGIFRILQTVLDDTRASQAYLLNDQHCDTNTDPYSREMKLHADRRLTERALQIVHTLASQVAFCKDGECSSAPSLTLQRHPSGPETLSQALFDMLYAELFSCMKQIMGDAHDPGGDSTPATEKSDDLSVGLQGDKYAYRILRLLFCVSDSKVCQRYLSTPKWLTLLVSSVGFGDTCVQRRLLRLICRLLIVASPDTLRVHTGELFERNEDIVLTDGAFDEDDVEAMITANADLSTGCCAERLLLLFLQASTVTLASSIGSDEGGAVAALVEVEDGVSTLTAECITILRMLEYVPAWRSTLVATLRRPMQWLAQQDSTSLHALAQEWNSVDNIALVSGVMGVLGGHIDRMRVGGTVTLRPFSLASMTDSFAFRLACISHSSAMLVSRLSLTNSVEVVLMERSPNSTHYSIPTGSVPVRPVKISRDDVLAAPDILPCTDFFDVGLVGDCVTFVKRYCLPLVQQTIRKLEKVRVGNPPSKPAPVESGRYMGLDDPDDDDVDFEDDDEDPEEAFARARARMMRNEMMQEDTTADGEADDNSQTHAEDDEGEYLSELEALRVRVSATAMRAVADLTRYGATISCLGESDIMTFRSIMDLAVTRVTSGGLSEIEAIEYRWATIWESYSLLPYSKQSDDIIDTENPVISQVRSRVLDSSRAVTGEQAASGREASISSNMLASLLGGPPSAAEANRAREQMMEMGFPREWCEVALRRCRYNVEMAINLCFEHGPDMNQIVAEETALASAASSARASGRNRVSDSREAALDLVARLAGRRAARSRESDGATNRQQLLAMGFAPGLCERALQQNGNDVDSALAWILVNSGDEAADDGLLPVDDEKEEMFHGDSKDNETSSYGPNPLSVIGGTANLSEDLSVGNGGSGFPSVGCRGYHVTSGKWYYEISLETAGCMQFGWADLSYEGRAEHGEGVGDDAHSWAYDGWRKLKWNHVSAEWGAKWAPNDVVGCLLDMDNRRMAFTLNGFGSEIDMGVAFEDFSFFGGLYPCVSFNRQEKMRFNFGYNSFTHPPPPEYLPFAEHVQHCLNANILKLQALLTFKTKISGSEEDGRAMEGFGGAFFEDCLEEQRGEGDFLSHKRYFQSDEATRGESVEHKARQAAAAIMSAPIPRKKAELLREFEKLSVELCVLYSRMIILRVANAYSRDPAASFIVDLLSQPQESSTSSCADQFMHILRESSVCTLRTKVYVHTISIISPSSLPPPNLGSVFSTGGAPLLSTLQNALAQALQALIAQENSSLVTCILEQIHVECMLSTRREYSVEWRVEGGYTPVIYQDSSSSSLKKDKNIPSLILAAWLSNIMMRQMIGQASSLPEKGALVVAEWVQSLVDSWMMAFKSPVIAVKLCACRMLNNLMQEIFFGGSFPNSIRVMTADIVMRSIPLDRLERLVLLRMEQEKGSQPICSEYLQCMIELAIAVRVCTDSTHDAGLLPDSRLASYPQSEAEANDQVSDFNWDAICGSLLSDDGWEVWSGSVRQLESPFSVPSTPTPSYRVVSGKNENPPALLPGCKVARMLKSRQRARSEGERSDDGNSGEERRPPRGGLMQLLSERLGGELNESEYDVGTVTKVCAWPSCEMGSAREVEWVNGGREVVRWGAHGEYDVAHVVLDSKKKVQSQHPYPVCKERLAKKAGFACDVSFGVILRLRSLPASDDDDEDIQGRFDGLMEWPDFKATVYVTGVMYMDGQWTLVEEGLIGGSKDADWTARFGEAKWQRGTTYDLALPRYSESEEIVNSMGHYLLGQFHYPVHAFSDKTVHITGDIRIQQSRLFTFDRAYCASSVTISHDHLAASCGGGEGKCCVYASVGFSTGVHYWEYKIERCDLGNIFIGVAEKTPQSPQQLRLNKWPGFGFINLRASHRNAENAQGDSVYGDIFQTGDTVGVLLDMNRGRLSFFLDAMKYGEHLLTDLGEAFDTLTAGSSLRAQKRTFFPVVGFRRAGDRVAITPRWISSTGEQNAYNMFRNVSRAWNLLSSWSEERPSTTPQKKDMWTYREAWRDWIRWKSNRFVKVRARSRALNLLVGLDIGPRACVDASIRLGLLEALFHGDRVVFTKSCGRVLEAKEEAVILGSYRGQLWYRFDSQSGDGVLVESSGLAWCLAPDDIENMELVRRGVILTSLPVSIVTAPLARIPAYRGGLLRITYGEGAVIRGGLEIDSSDSVGNVMSGALVWALHRRMSSSNIARYLIHYQGTFGWISERIRGGSEEYMVRTETAEPAHVVAEYKHAAATAVAAQGLPLRVHWEEAASPADAMRAWEKVVIANGCAYLLEPGNLLAESYHSGEKESFEDFLALSTTTDGTHNWPVECDMLLTDFLSRIASKFGQSPFNITCDQVTSSLDQLDAQSLLRQISSERIVARSSVIRCANVIIGYALPYLEVTLPETKWRQNVAGNRSDLISIVGTELPGVAGTSCKELTQIEKDMRYLGDNSSQMSLEHQFVWRPPCGARRLRSKRRVLFTQTKGLLWENVLEATTTMTPLHQDEYEDPREIKMIKINRIKATQVRLGAISNQSERIKQSVFGQLHKEMRLWPGSSFRRSYLGKGHGGQKRAFKVTFMGEGVNDYGGPYRAVFQQIVDEVQCDTALVGRKTGDKCLLPLLVPCPNRSSAVGANQDKFLLSSAATTPLSQELMQFFGKICGTAIRHCMNMGLNLSSMLWRPVVGLDISRAHLATIDVLAANDMAGVERLGLELEEDGRDEDGKPLDSSYVPNEWVDLNFTVTTADGSRVSLLPKGTELQVNLGNWREYLRLVERYRLRESTVMYRALCDGLSAVIPTELFPIFTPTELEQLMCGSTAVDINLLRQCTEYDDISPDSTLVKFFWEVLEEMTDDERTLFLRFVWARSRMPASAQDLLMNFKLQAMKGEAEAHPDDYLPHAQTCFFSLSLPPYSSKEVLRQKILYAINNSPNMDADVRLHNADGWADS